jgi:dipeptidyl aminopeptidase/acylaminoacyl peptidase
MSTSGLSRALKLGGLLALAAAAAIAGRAWKRARAEYQRAPHSVPRPPESAALAGLFDVSFTARDGAVLRGWYAPSRNRAAVVLVHGSEADRRQMLPDALLLARHGYGVLLFDSPGVGESSGKVTLGSSERTALRASLDWLGIQTDVDPARIGVDGFSAGATTAAVEAAHDPRIRALVLEGIAGGVVEQTRAEFARFGPLSQWPAILARRAAGWDPAEPSAQGSIAAFAGRPVLFIVGTDDPVVAPMQTLRTYALARAPKDLWVVPGAHHGDYAAVEPAEHERRLAAFFDGALRAAP